MSILLGGKIWLCPEKRPGLPGRPGPGQLPAVETPEGKVTWPRILAAIDTLDARLCRRIELLQKSQEEGRCGDNDEIKSRSRSGSSHATSKDAHPVKMAAATAKENTVMSPKGDAESRLMSLEAKTSSRLVSLEARISAMEAQMEDMQQHEDEYLSGRYDCECLADSLKDLLIAVHRESDIRQKQIAFLDQRLSQRWQHAEALQQQIEALAKRVEPILDDDFPKLQWFRDRIEELDRDAKDIRSAGERTLATFTESMADLERNVSSVGVGPPHELSATNGSIKAASSTVTDKDSCNEDCEQAQATQRRCLTSSVSLSSSSIFLPRSAKVSREDGTERGSRVRRLVVQFTEGAGGTGTAAPSSSARGVGFWECHAIGRTPWCFQLRYGRAFAAVSAASTDAYIVTTRRGGPTWLLMMPSSGNTPDGDDAEVATRAGLEGYNQGPGKLQDLLLLQQCGATSLLPVNSMLHRLARNTQKHVSALLAVD